MSLKVKNISSRKIRNMNNGVLGEYLSASGDIAANTFVEFADSVKTQIKVSTSTIDGILMTKASTTTKGKVWTL